jgi:two-component system, NtrC family, response regulator
MARILIVDDDEMTCETLLSLIRSQGHQVDGASRLKQGYRQLMKNSYDLVFLDVNLPDGNGIEAVTAFRNTPSFPEVVIITGEGDPDGAELALKSGSWDYVCKPFSLEEIRLPLVRALQYRKEKSSGKAPLALRRTGIIGSSPETNTCLDLVAKAAHTNNNVLITGETGTGKELFARAIHENSSRSNRPFVVIDCAALPESLVESTLFGHEKGAFTGADRSREGLIKEADGGTLLLDEIGELPLAQQGAFLRVLQERRFRPVGSRADVFSDFRLIAATNRSIGRMVQAGTFREDLLFRLRSTSIDLPPLRNRLREYSRFKKYGINKDR